MKRFLTPVFLVGLLVSISSVNAIAGSNYYCYEEIGGGARYYLPMPIVQPQKAGNAAETLGNGFIALGALIKRNVSFVEEGGTRYSTTEYTERLGGAPQDRLVIQFLPASGFHAGTLPAGTVQMTNSTLVERAERHDIVMEGGANDVSGSLEVFPVVAIKGYGKDEITCFDDAQEFYRYEGNDYFDEQGKLKESVFKEKKGDMCVAYIERNANITSFLRFKTDDRWGPGNDLMYEKPFGVGKVYETGAGDIYAIDFDCLTDRQAEYVRKGSLGRAFQTTKETVGNWLKKGKDALPSLKLLGQ